MGDFFMDGFHELFGYDKDDVYCAYISVIDSSYREHLLTHGIFSAVGDFYLNNLHDMVFVFKSLDDAFNYATENFDVIRFVSAPVFSDGF